MSHATIHQGSMGPDVATWQGVIGVPSDGVFGPATAAATKIWQAAHGLAADGVVGPGSWGAAELVAPATEVLKGCDLSAIQGVRADSEWAALAAMGLRFAFGRTIVGNETWTDTAAVENARRARAHGILFWPYVFLYPLPHLSPEAQAEDFARRLEPMGLLGGPVAADAEWPPREEKAKDGSIVQTWLKWGCTPEHIRDWLTRFFVRFDTLIGRKTTAYSFRYWLACILAWLCPELAERPLWLADYTYEGRWPTREQCASMTSPAPWSRIQIVQHDGDGGLRLPSGTDADFNVFLGGESELAAYVAGEAVPSTAIASARLNVIGDAAIADYRRARITS